MPSRPCLGCGNLTRGSYCPACRPVLPGGHWSRGRNRNTQHRFRNAVLANAGLRCQAIERGHRCPETNGLQAHHTQPGNDDPTTGVALCSQHHRAVDPHAR